MSIGLPHWLLIRPLAPIGTAVAIMRRKSELTPRYEQKYPAVVRRVSSRIVRLADGGVLV